MICKQMDLFHWISILSIVYHLHNLWDVFHLLFFSPGEVIGHPVSLHLEDLCCLSLPHCAVCVCVSVCVIHTQALGGDPSNTGHRCRGSLTRGMVSLVFCGICPSTINQRQEKKAQRHKQRMGAALAWWAKALKPWHIHLFPSNIFTFQCL
jgi:hypothetical protein